MKEKISITLSKQVIKNVDSLVDRLFIRNRSQAIEVLLKTYLNKNKPAVILLGGPEEKLKVGGEYVPLIKVKGTPLIEQAVRKLRKEDFREIYIIARKKILEKVFSVLKNGAEYGIKIKYIEEKESKGTADSLRLIKKEISTTFLVVFGDILFERIKLEEIWDSHITNNVVSTLNLITFDKPSIKGEVFLEGNRIIKFNQKPKKWSSYLVFSPIFVCEPELLQYPGDSLEEDIFPVLAKKQLLNGYVSTEREIHIHTERNLKDAN